MDTGEPTLTPGPIVEVKVPKQPATLESLADSRAQVDPLPGSLLNAFMPGSIKVADRYVRKFVAYDYVTLKALDSPLLRMMLELAKPSDLQEKVDNNPEEEWDLCWQFTHTSRECRDLLAQGTDVFHKTSLNDVGEVWEPETVQLVLTAIFTQLRRNMDTAQRYIAQAKEANEITFFNEPMG
jgi:hypothetical protein